jgi:predicted AAA+ superfamily ATPase
VQVHVDVKNTSKRYLDCWKMRFVFVRLNGFSRNLRQEVIQQIKYYFFVRVSDNAIIAQFNPWVNVNDTGALWENFLMMERVKYRTYLPLHANAYFWRTYEQQEIDLIEEHSGRVVWI